MGRMCVERTQPIHLGNAFSSNFSPFSLSPPPSKKTQHTPPYVQEHSSHQNVFFNFCFPYSFSRLFFFLSRIFPPIFFCVGNRFHFDSSKQFWNVAFFFFVSVSPLPHPASCPSFPLLDDCFLFLIRRHQGGLYSWPAPNNGKLVVAVVVVNFGFQLDVIVFVCV